jgi:hypothetical protein
MTVNYDLLSLDKEAEKYRKDFRSSLGVDDRDKLIRWYNIESKFAILYEQECC